MKPKTKRGKRRPLSATKLFRFTEEDEAMMEKTIKSSIRFMESYGKGRSPYSLIADYKYYN